VRMPHLCILSSWQAECNSEHRRGLQGAEIEHVLKSVMRKQVMVGKQAVLDLASQPQVPRSVLS